MNKLLKISIVIGIPIIALSVAYYFVIFLPHNQQTKSDNKVNSAESMLRARFKEFSDKIDVNLCQETYDEFITAGSKQRKGYQNFLAHCKYRAEDWRNFNISNIVFSNSERADIKYSYDLSLPDTYSSDFNKCLMRNGDDSFFFCSDISPKKVEKRETVETWLMEDGKWKRDY